MPKRYKCKETFYLEKYDDDGMPTDKQFAIVKGSIWEEDIECKYRICGGADTVVLNRIAPKKTGWLEITRATLERSFELMN